MFFDAASARFVVRLRDEDKPEEWKRIGREHLKPVRTDDSKEFVSPVFDLLAVSTHSGDACFGHYMAYVRSCEDGIWRLYNDDNVQEVSEQEVSAQQIEAYLLFYLQRNCRPPVWGQPANG